MHVGEYIKNNWKQCVKNNMHDDGTLIGLPYPYTVPAIGSFDELYYWDTYFTNLGLIHSDMGYMAKYNVDNMLFLVEKYGFMPNGNRTYYLNRSQPPFLSEMVKDIFEYYHDLAWLTGAFAILKKEYEFWNTKRKSYIGLNIYSGNYDNNDAQVDFESLKKRVGYVPNKTENELGRHMLATCESGWDCNPRWEFECYNCVPVDLNSLLYLMEKNMQYFSEELDNGESEIWDKAAQKRQKLIMKYMKTSDDILLDYNFVKQKTSNIFSMASFYPLYAGVATKSNAESTMRFLYKLEGEHGLYACEKNTMPGVYQWSYPNGWACHQYIAIVGMLKYGYTEEAKRIAHKYINIIDENFKNTGILWEKYNVNTGNTDALNEYDMPPMLGWTAGVYIALKKLIAKIE